jgi:hypothetical protein
MAALAASVGTLACLWTIYERSGGSRSATHVKVILRGGGGPAVISPGLVAAAIVALVSAVAALWLHRRRKRLSA